MTDTTHDLGIGDDGFHEIHLSGKQLVFLFIATTIVSVLIFLLGVMVGRGVPAQRLQASDSFTDAATAAGMPASLSAPEPAPAPVPAPPVADAGPPAAEPPPPAGEAVEPEELSYKQRLESEKAATESLKPRSSPPAARPAATPSSAASTSAAAGQSAVSGTPQPGTWVVQVHALRDRSVASGIVQRLAAKGYPAFLVAAGPPTGAYKVQIGRFRGRDEAQRVVERLKKEEQFNPWITR